METQPSDGRTIRPRRKKQNILTALNCPIETIDLSVHAQASLIKLGIKNLAQFKREIENGDLPLEIMGLKSRREINNVFKRINIDLPPNWLCGIKQ